MPRESFSIRLHLSGDFNEMSEPCGQICRGRALPEREQRTFKVLQVGTCLAVREAAKDPGDEQREYGG